MFCIRFRYDEENRKRLKTVELIVEESNWTPPLSSYAVDALVSLRIEASNMSLRTQAKVAGAKWNPDKRLWTVKIWKYSRNNIGKAYTGR